MSAKPFIPESWALPVAALTLGATIEEAQYLVDEGVIDLTDYRTVERELTRRTLARLRDLFKDSL